MRVAVSRRRLLQLAMAPAFLSRATRRRRTSPAVSRIYPGGDGRLVYVPDEQGNIIHDALTPDTAAAAWPFPQCRSERPSGRSPVTTVRMCRRQSTGFRHACRTPRDSAGPSSGRLLPDRHPLRIQASGVLRGEGMGDTAPCSSAPAPAGPRQRPAPARGPPRRTHAGNAGGDRRRVGRYDQGRQPADDH